jgi:hypothetical protein
MKWRVIMRKITYLVPFLTLIFLLSSTSGEKKTSQGPKIFLPEEEWDFGYIPQGATVSHFFKIKNIGDDTLQIVKVRPGCACTYAPLKKDLFAPQESTYLEVIFNSRNYQGLKNMDVAIFSNDTSSVSNIYFTANVENVMPLVKIDPLQVKFDSAQIGKNVQKKVNILNGSGSLLPMTVVEKPKDLIDFQISKSDLNPKEKIEITFQINPKATPGPFQTNLTLDFQGAEKVRYTLPISGTIISK